MITMNPKANTIRIVSIAIIAVILLNLVLFAFRKITTLVFWLVIVVAALLAYKVIPWLKNKK